MKLFAPKHDGGWSMTDPNSWWPLQGTMPTVSGKRVSEDTALTFSACFAATRIISEGIAAIPCQLKERIDYRTKNDAVNHPLWRIVHDVPNPEQDKMCWFDMQTAFLPNWGNCYSEKQFNQAGEIVALWPIHPSRIPLANITRNGTDPGSVYKIVVGQPGEIVYWVKNDDNSLTPIPASDMLHVPGVLSSNGITGQSIIRWAANSIGIAQSTEESAGALFKNGALTNMVIKTMKIVGKETADRLRQQWQQTFGGSMNHYKTLLLEDGMEPVPIQMKPEDTQLILQRQFGISEIARWWKIPPHMLGDLSRATFSNIEQQYLEFVVHSLGPWVVRWECAMNRQLLTPKEQQRFYFKFNLNAMLRGDSAARSAFYKSLFDMGVVSPNDIRELEDWNPVEGGDQRFVPANNVVPLNMVEDLVQSQIDKNSAPPVAPARPSPEPQQAAAAIAAEFKVQREFLRLHLENGNGNGHSDQLRPIAEKLDGLPALLTERVEELAQQAAATRETAESDAIAAEKALLEQKKAEIEQKAASERESTDKMLVLALKKNIDSLAVWESKALLKAREKPTELAEWRVKFYQRFIKQFIAELSEFVPGAEACGIALDLKWAAEKYAAASISDLKSLDKDAKDNFFDRVKECTDHFIKRGWTDRSKALADEMVARGRKEKAS